MVKWRWKDQESADDNYIDIENIAVFS